MKITDISVISKRLPRAPALVQVDTDEGISGVGATSAPVSVITAMIENEAEGLRSMFIGEDPTNTNLAWQSTAGGSKRGRSGEGGVAINAMGAIDMALWDIAGKARDVPIYKLLGGAVQPEVMVYASATAFNRRLMEETGEWEHKSTEELVRESQENVAHGFKAMKFGWGNYFDQQDLEALDAIREVIGPDIELMLDFGSPAYLEEGWNVKDAIRVSEVLDEFDVFFLEEPLHPYDFEGFATLTEASPIKIATGESLTTVRDFQQFIEGRAVDIVQPDAQQIGITQFCRVAQRAEEAGIPCIPHGPWTAFTVAAHLNVLATLNNGIMIEYPSPAIERGSVTESMVMAMHDKVIETPLELRDGYLQLPDSPGLGLGGFVPEAIAELESQFGQPAR